jgi:hypothetical protein
MEHAVMLFGTGLLAGTMNAVAGGGTFITLPALVFAGVPSVAANESSTVALVPAAIASSWAYRHDLKGIGGVSLWAMAAVSLAGGLAGALLLLFTPQRTFDVLVPWLMLIGSLAFAIGRRVGAWLRPIIHIGAVTLLFGQFILGIYGGYFGGGVGILMMAVWSLFTSAGIMTINAARTVLVGTLNAVAVVCFVLLGKIWWPQTIVLLVAATLGGYFGARAARRLPPERLRLGMVVFNFAITAVFFVRSLHFR